MLIQNLEFCSKSIKFADFLSLALLVLVIQIVSGIFLTMNYKPDGNLNAYHLPAAFTAVEYIMRDVSGGWIIRLPWLDRRAFGTSCRLACR